MQTSRKFAFRVGALIVASKTDRLEGRRRSTLFAPASMRVIHTAIETFTRRRAFIYQTHGF